jgi:hypothetical protein
LKALKASSFNNKVYKTAQIQKRALGLGEDTPWIYLKSRENQTLQGGTPMVYKHPSSSQGRRPLNHIDFFLEHAGFTSHMLNWSQ